MWLFTKLMSVQKKKQKQWTIIQPRKLTVNNVEENIKIKLGFSAQSGYSRNYWACVKEPIIKWPKNSQCCVIDNQWTERVEVHIINSKWPQCSIQYFFILNLFNFHSKYTIKIKILKNKNLLILFVSSVDCDAICWWMSSSFFLDLAFFHVRLFLSTKIQFLAGIE